MGDWKVIEDNDKIKEEFKGYPDGLVRYGDGNLAILPATAEMMKEYKNMKVRENDIWVVTYPKCGTTWTQEMVWQIVNKCDFDGGKVPLCTMGRFPFLELETLIDVQHSAGLFAATMFGVANWWSQLSLWKPSSWLGRSQFHQIEDADNQRFIKTHLPISTLAPNLLKTSKVIYVARNPKDTMVSYYYHHKHIKGHDFVGDFPTFARRFMKDQVMISPFFQHLEEAWQLRNNSNLLFIFFEDMKKDLRSVVEKVSKFLNCTLSESEIEKLLDHLDIKNFRNNPAVNNEWGKEMGVMSKEGTFIRKGKVGGYKEDFKDHPELEKEFDEWIKKEMEKCSIEFPKH